MDSGISFVWKFFVETVFIILMRTLHMTAISSCQNIHVINLVKSLEPTPCLVSDDAGAGELRLNRCLPIFQGFLPTGQDREDYKTMKCYWCGSTEARSWCRVPADETLTKYAYLNCHRCESRRTFDPAGVAAREKRDERKSWVKKDFCESCGETIGPFYFHPALTVPLTICSREHSYHHRHGVLRPTPRHA